MRGVEEFKRLAGVPLTEGTFEPTKKKLEAALAELRKQARTIHDLAAKLPMPESPSAYNFPGHILMWVREMTDPSGKLDELENLVTKMREGE
jgi:hypothetical protein